MRCHHAAGLRPGSLKVGDTLTSDATTPVLIGLDRYKGLSVDRVYFVVKDTVTNASLVSVRHDFGLASANPLYHCLPPDQIAWDGASADYANNPGPIILKITNGTTRTWRNLATTLTIDPARFYSEPEDSVQRYDSLPPGKEAVFLWSLVAISQAGYVKTAVSMRLMSDEGVFPLVMKDCSLMTGGSLCASTSLTTSMRSTGDTLQFYPGIDDYRDDLGTRSSTGDRNAFVVTAKVFAGCSTLHRLAATILPYEDMHIDDGDTARKVMDRLGARDTATFSWRVRPHRERLTHPSLCQLMVTSAGMSGIMDWKLIIVEGTDSHTAVAPLAAAGDTPSLEAPSPHPMSGATTLRCVLPHGSYVRLSVLDLLGHELATIDESRRDAGWQTFDFDASTLSAGTYLLQLLTADGAARKLVRVIR
jgi:hypothetical protein